MKKKNNSSFYPHRLDIPAHGKINYDLFGDDNLEDLHWGKVYLRLFGRLFSTYSVRHKIMTEKVIEKISSIYKLRPSHKIKIENSFAQDFTKTEPEHNKTLLILREGFCVAVHGYGLHILYSHNIPRAEVLKLAGIAEEFKIQNDQNESSFNMISRSVRGALSLTTFNVRKCETDIDSNYNDDFAEVHREITTSLCDKNKNGIVLLHGNYGSGKTYYIRHLISTLKLCFIYLPSYLMDAISSPDFLPFITDYKDSVLILEDCESLLMHRESGYNGSTGLSNLLNLGDGLLSDALSIKIICSFNAGIKKIDDALLRKGRLIARYEFRELETRKAQQLLNKLGKNYQTDRPMNLSEIYNIESHSYQTPPANKIGFTLS